MNFIEGQQVVYSYMHATNSTTYTQVTKRGLFVRYNPDKTKCFVLLEGNARASWKPVKSITKYEKGAR